MRKTPLNRKTPLAQGKPLARSKGLRYRSPKTAKVYRDERVPLVVSTLEERPWCELRFPGCWGNATVVDERKQRSRGGSITDPANLSASCVFCNGYKEDHPAEAEARGLALHSWDEVADEHPDTAGGWSPAPMRGAALCPPMGRRARTGMAAVATNAAPSTPSRWQGSRQDGHGAPSPTSLTGCPVTRTGAAAARCAVTRTPTTGSASGTRPGRASPTRTSILSC